MKIINENGNFKLQYRYKIITNRHKRQTGTYYYYTTQFSCEIIEYFKTTIYYVYEYGNKHYLSTNDPSEYGYKSKKIKARDKYTTSKIRVIPVNSKIFNLKGNVTDKYLKITLHLTEKDIISDNILVELEVE